MDEERWDHQEPVWQQSVILPLLMVGIVVLGIVIIVGGAWLLCAY